MKLIEGTDKYKKFSETMVHEFSLCEQAFDEHYIWFGENLVNKNNNYKVLERIYESYSKFIVHLYEFYVACIKRNQRDSNIHYSKLDKLLTLEVEKLMNNMCYLIENNAAPDWVNDLSYYQEKVPEDFGKKFRTVRNSVAHVDLRRIGGSECPTLKEFRDDYHKFIYFLYDSARFAWSSKREPTFELSHIKEFDLSNNS